MCSTCDYEWLRLRNTNRWLTHTHTHPPPHTHTPPPHLSPRWWGGGGGWSGGLAVGEGGWSGGVGWGDGVTTDNHMCSTCVLQVHVMIGGYI